MKKTAFLLLPLFFASVGYAQVPQALNYQAIARNSGGQIIPSQSIGVRFSITNATGNTILYQETHSAVTNAFGLFTLAIGRGTAMSGTIPQIDWAAGGDKYLKVEIAPQGGTNYTMQGSTQLLSVPYALYAEKTRLIGGNAITITNGNTISANYVAGNAINITGNTISGNYQAGTGISITGSVISSTATLNSWLLTGNAGTTTANFLGTTDNQRINFRTNNITRMYLDQSITGFGVDLGHLSLSTETDVAIRPAQISVFGRDIAGASLTGLFVSYVGGSTWGVAGGNTLGRFFRLSQMATTFVQSHFYDFGMSQDSSFYITNHGFQNIGGVMPKKMFTISAQDMIGINLDMSEKPSAVLHTKGSLRFQNINTNNSLTRILAMDANGNVSSRDASTLTGGSLWVADANGIHNATGNVGIGASSNSGYKLEVSDFSGAILGAPMVNFNSNDSWQTHFRLQNSNSNRAFSIVVGGTGNTQATYGVGSNNFGIANNGSTFPILITSDDKVGIGMGLGGTNNQVKAQLHVKTGDIYIEQITSGVIMKSPDGQCWRMTVSNAGAPVFTAIPCP